METRAFWRGRGEVSRAVDTGSGQPGTRTQGLVAGQDKAPTGSTRNRKGLDETQNGIGQQSDKMGPGPGQARTGHQGSQGKVY